MLALAALAFSGVTSAASSDSGSGSADSSTSQQKTQQLMQQYRQKAMQLKQIHQKTINNDPQLASEQDKFEKQVRDAVEDQGYNIEKGEQRMQAAAKKLQSGKKLSDADRKSAIQDFQSERQKMIKARDAALQKPEIQTAGHKLENDTLTAMKKQDSHTDQLLSDMKSLRSQLRAAMPSPAQQSSKNG